jgi:hypothetical protein
MDLSKEMSIKDLLPIIKEVPDAKYFILNSGSIMPGDEDKEFLKNTNMLIDTSGRGISNLGELIKTYGRDKFAFGTHSPILDYLTGLLRIESLRPNEADETTKELLRSGNAKRILVV